LAATLGALTLAFVALIGAGVASATSTANTALINGDTVTTVDGFVKEATPISLEQFAAEQAGYTVTVKTGAEWDAMTSEEFAKYQVLVVGDPDCNNLAPSVVSNAATWTSVVMGSGGGTGVGNRALVGTDPEFHYPSHHGAEHLVQDGITFAGAVPGATGAYFDTSCGEENGKEITETLDKLTTTGPGHWSLNTEPPCGGSVQQIAENPAFNSGETKLEDSDIQGWSCSDHVTFPAFPTDWNALAVATDTPTKPTCGTDPNTKETACGQAYVLVSGTGVVATSPNISLQPLNGEQAAGGVHAVTATVGQEVHPVAAARSGSAAATLPPVVGTVVSFAVTGQNSGVAGTCTYPSGEADPECKTDVNGQVVFTYPDTNGAGTDTINASVTLPEAGTQHATAAWTWTPAPAPPAPVITPAAKPVSAVLAVKEVVPAKGTAHTSSIRGCIAQTGYLASVAGTSIAAVTFTLDGHTLKTLHRPTSGTTFAVRVPVRSGSAHHLGIHVVFTASSKTRATTFRKTLARCAVRHVSLPRFTG
jgi:hypothetical protein